MKHQIFKGELWVLVEVYISGRGFVAHWFSHSGVHRYEDLKVVCKLTRGPNLAYS